MSLVVALNQCFKTRSALLFALVSLGVCGPQSHAQTTLQLQPGNTAVTLAGSGKDGVSTAGAATASAMGSPRGMAYTTNGSLVVADTRNHVVVSIATDGTLSIVAGTGRQGFAGDGGAATSAELNAPEAVVVDSTGNLYIADTGNQRVRKVSTAGVVTTIAGTGNAGYGADGGPAAAALLRQPRGLALDTAGNLYIADTGNHRVRMLKPDGTIVAFAGTGTEGDDGDGGPALAAAFREPAGLAVSAAGGLLIVDRAAGRVRSVAADGTVTAYNVSTRRPEGVAVSSDGSVYLADAGNQSVLHSSQDGVSTIAGSAEQGAFTAGSPVATSLNNPAAILIAGNGDVMVSDKGNHQVQRVALPHLEFGSVAAGAVSAAQDVTLLNTGTQALQVLAIQLPDGFVAGGASGPCGAVPFTLQPSAQCVVAVAFSPVAQGAQTGVAQVRVSGAAPAGVLLTGTGTASGTLSSSSVTMISNGNISYVGAAVSINVAVSGGLSMLPVGNVGFYDGTTLLTTIALTGGSAHWSTAALTQGQHTLHAVYSGDAHYAGSSSATLGETIIPAPDFAVSSIAASYSGSAGGAISIPMTISPVNGTLNHPIAFAVSGLPSGASASFLPATLTLGGDPLSINLAIQMPVTLSYGQKPLLPLLGVVTVAAGLRKRRLASLLCLVLVVGVCAGGCGGGFRGGSSTAAGPKTFNYTAVVTATTTGVLGDTLTHSTTIGLVVTQ